MEVPKWKLSLLNYPRAASMRIGAPPSQPNAALSLSHPSPLFFFPAADEQEVLNLVLFLENRHIRQLDVEERKPLEGSPSDAWHTALAAYLATTGCPLLRAAYSRARLAEYVHWLVAHAIAVGYEEGAEALNRDAAEFVAGGTAGGGGAAAASPPPSSAGAVEVPPEAAAVIAQLAALCHVNTAGRTPFEVLQAVGRAVRQRLLPGAAACEAAAVAAEEDGHGPRSGGGAGSGSGSSSGNAAAAADKTSAALALAATTEKSSLAAFAGKPLPAAGSRRGRRAAPRPLGVEGEESSGGGGGGGRPPPVLDPHAFPLGFHTGDGVVDTAAALLRMLYVADLRELQDAVNDILITVQEFTADPRTDSSLGKVGR